MEEPEALGEPARAVQLYSRDGLTVWAGLAEGGSLRIEGQDLGASRVFGDDVAEYEYGLVVAAEDLPRVVAALGGPPGADVLDLLEASGEQIVRAGETRWLRDAGVEAEFWSHMG